MATVVSGGVAVLVLQDSTVGIRRLNPFTDQLHSWMKPYKEALVAKISPVEAALKTVDEAHEKVKTVKEFDLTYLMNFVKSWQ